MIFTISKSYFTSLFKLENKQNKKDMTKRALITGVTGQNGTYLADLY